MLNLKSMNLNDPLLNQTLWTGRLLTRDGEKLAILKTIRSGEMKEFIFELKNPQTLKRPNICKCILVTIRAFSLTAMVSPGLVVLGTGILVEHWHSNLFLFFASILSVTFLQIAVNVFNDVQDHLKGVDLPGDIGGSGVIQKGWLSAKTVSKIGATSLGLSIGLGIFPLVAYPRELLAIALCAFIGGVGYSGLGIGLKYRAFGDFAVFFLCGPLLAIGFSIAAFGKLSASVVLVGITFGLASVAILHANNLNDLEIDAERGARTIANQIGFKWSQKYLGLIYAAIFINCMIFATFMHEIAIFLLAPLWVSPLVYRMLQKVRKASGPLSPSISKIRFEAAQIHLLIGVTWLALFLGKVLLKSYSG